MLKGIRREMERVLSLPYPPAVLTPLRAGGGPPPVAPPVPTSTGGGGWLGSGARPRGQFGARVGGTRDRTRPPRALLIFLLIIFLAVSSGCARDLVTGKKTYNWFDLNYDVKLGKQVIDEQMKELHKKKKKVDEEADARMTEKIRSITKRIAVVSHIPNFPYESHFADVDVVNAWCAPGGKVMVYNGLFDPKKGLVNRSREDELAAVLGHEIAHATARHVTESISRNMSIVIVGQVAISAISASGTGTVQDMFNRTIAEGINLYIPAYSRKNESEADKIGLIYMAKAGYNPKAAVDLWYRACKKKGGKTDLYASHPSSCERAKALEKLLPEAMAEYKKTH